MNIKPLNQFVEAVNYNLFFTPDLNYYENKLNTYNGSVIIELNIRKPVSKIILNQLNLTIKNIFFQQNNINNNDNNKKIKNNKNITIIKNTSKFNKKINNKINNKNNDIDNIAIPKNQININNKDQLLTINLKNKIQKGKAFLSIDFEGTMGDDLAGIYRSKYKSRKNKDAYMLTTQFEASHARKAFPCIDEPAAKATFDVTLAIDKNLQAISNMPIIKTDIKNNKKFVSFEKTPKMSTYLLYLGVGDFDYLNGQLRDIKLRIVTPPNRSHLAHFAMEALKKFLPYYEFYFGIKYPLPKLDLIAVADFGSGAMENYGAITFREDALLFDPKKSSIATKQTITSIIAHELVHMWFGNLATMKWWNDLWLNESFADYLAYKAVASHYPILESWSNFFSRRVPGAFDLDSLKNSHPIIVDVKDPGEIREVFDAISYTKGGLVLRMLELYLSENVFRKAMHKYLVRYAYANAEAKDLWNCLSEVSGEDVLHIMHSWLRQTGYPLVSIEQKDFQLLINQQRFQFFGSTDKSLWKIPLVIKTDKKIIKKIISKKIETIKIDNCAWLKANYQQSCFLRINYSNELLQKLNFIIKNKKIENLDRYGIHNDLSALMLSRRITVKQYLNFLNTYENEDDYLVLLDIFGTLQMLALILYDESFSSKIIESNKKFYEKIFKIIGWEKSSEKETAKLVRSELVSNLGRLGNKEILSKASLLFNNYLKTKTIDPNLRYAVLKLTAWQGNEKTYDVLQDFYRKAENPQEQLDLLRSLAWFRDKNLLNRSLEFALTKEVRNQNIMYLVMEIAVNPYGKMLIWPWIKRHWPELKKKFEEAMNHLNYMLKSLVVMADMKYSKEIKQFFAKYPLSGTQRTLAQMLEKLEVYDRFVKKAREEFD